MPRSSEQETIHVSPPPARPPVVFPRGCRLLKDIDDAGFCQLCECMGIRELHLRDRQRFIAETDPCDRIGIVVTGAVRLTRQRIDGGRNVLETITAGGVFGMTYVFRDAPTMGIGMHAVGETIVLLFEIARITRPCHRVCGAHMQFVRNLLTIMSQTTFALKQKLRVLSQRTIRGRLLLFLNICAKRAKAKTFDIPFDRQALADYLCVDRSALSAELSKLRDEGKVASVKSHFTLLA